MYHDSFMQESIKKVEAAREANMKMEPRRMTAEEKDALLKTYHPDYREDQFDTLAPRRDRRFRRSGQPCCRGNPGFPGWTSIWSIPIMMWTC